MPVDYPGIRARAGNMISRYGMAAYLVRAGNRRDCTVLEVEFLPRERGSLANPTDRLYL